MFPNSQQYGLVSHSSEEKEPEVPFSDQASEDEPFIQNRQTLRSSNERWAIPWILCAFFATTTGALLFLLLIQMKRKNILHGPGFSNEFIDPASIPLETVRFTGSPNFSLNGTMEHRPMDKIAKWPENVTYFGEPSPQLDENWEKLIGWRYFSISEEEAKNMFPDSYHEYVDQLQGGYTAGLDVFHTLHCVNTIRKALRPDYYKTHMTSDPPHIDHCLDAIRQYIQCAGVTTLVPTRFFEGIRRNYIDSDQLHTCRSFTFLREWTTNRRLGGPAYIERNLSIIDVEKNNMAHDKMEEVAAMMAAEADAEP